MKLFKVILFLFVSLVFAENLSAQWTDGTPVNSGNGLEATPAQFSNNGFAVKCDGGSDGLIRVTVTSGTGPFYYDWGNGDEGFGVAAPLQMVFEPATTKTAGTYQVTIYDTGNIVGGDADEITLTISILSPAALVFKSSGFGVSQTNPTCSYNTDGSISSKAQGGIGAYSYVWDDAGPTASRTITGIGHGSHIVTVTDGNSCIASKTYTIDQPTAIVPNLVITTEGCDGASGVITAVPAGGSGVYSSYSWDDASSQTTNPATGLTPGTYTVTVTDNSVPTGCVGTESITLNSPTAISVSSSTNLINCNGGNDGSANIVVSGGKAPYNISWTGTLSGDPAGDEITVSGGNYTMSFLREGSYNLTILDDNGCTETTTISISEPAAIVANATKNQDVTCNGDADGSITVVGSGGTVAIDYTYLWSDGQTTANAFNLAPGNYTVQVTDDNGCSITTTPAITITEPFPLTIPIVATDVSCNGGNNGMVN